MEKPWRSPRRHGRPNQQSSDDDGSDDEVNPQSKYAKKPLGKGRAFPPKKKAKTTKNTPVKDDSDDDNSSDDEETTFGMKSSGKKKGYSAFKLANSSGLDSKKALSNRTTLTSTGISSTAFSTFDFFSQETIANIKVKRTKNFFIIFNLKSHKQYKKLLIF